MGIDTLKQAVKQSTQQAECNQAEIDSLKLAVTEQAEASQQQLKLQVALTADRELTLSQATENSNCMEIVQVEMQAKLESLTVDLEETYTVVAELEAAQLTLQYEVETKVELLQQKTLENEEMGNKVDDFIANTQAEMQATLQRQAVELDEAKATVTELGAAKVELESEVQLL